MTNRISIVYLIMLSSVIQISAQQEVKLLGVEIDGNKTCFRDYDSLYSWTPPE